MNQNTQQAIAQAQAKGFVGIAELTQVAEEYRGLVAAVSKAKGVSPFVFRDEVSRHLYTANDLMNWIELARSISQPDASAESIISVLSRIRESC